MERFFGQPYGYGSTAVGQYPGVRNSRPLQRIGRARAGSEGRGAEYSTEVQQLTRTRAVVRGRGRTVTCTDGRGWTCCRQMACKRSAVRARLAPLVRSEIRTTRTASTAGKYSNGGRPAAVRVFGSGMFFGQGCWQDSGFQTLNRRWSACHLRKSSCHRSRDSCHRLTTRPSCRAIPASNCCRICKWSGRAGRPGRRNLSLPGNRASWPGRRVRRRQARRGGSARGADGVSAALGSLVRCATQAQSSAVAQLFARAPARWCVT